MGISLLGYDSIKNTNRRDSPLQHVYHVDTFSTTLLLSL